MSFVDREDILNVFEDLAKYLFRTILGKEFTEAFPRIGWTEAMEKYGSDKPDLRFGMTFNDLSEEARGKGFGVFDSAEYIGAICAEGCAGYTRKQLDGRQLSVERRQVLRTGGPGPVGRPMRSQAGRPAADSERSEKKHAIGLVRVAAGNGRAARTSSPRPVRAVVGRRFPVARMG